MPRYLMLRDEHGDYLISDRDKVIATCQGYEASLNAQAIWEALEERHARLLGKFELGLRVGPAIENEAERLYPASDPEGQ